MSADSRQSVEGSAQLIEGRYRLLDLLGAGGMGQVYRALDVQTEKVVAVKVLSDGTALTKGARERLLREGRAMMALSHPGIARVYAMGVFETGGAYVVMEMIEGQTLRALGASSTFSRRQRQRALVDVGRALAFAHRHGMVHRDVKPDNVMVRTDGSAVLLDFGLVKEVHPPASEEKKFKSFVTTAGNLLGTPAYMSPELIRADVIDGRADQWALAITAYELFTGKHPWQGESFTELLIEALTSKAIAPSVHRYDLPKTFDALIERAMQKDASRRYVDCDAFADALAQVSFESLTEDSQAPVWQSSAEFNTTMGEIPSNHGRVVRAAQVDATTTEPHSTVTKSRRWLVVAMVVPVLLLLAMIVFLLLAITGRS